MNIAIITLLVTVTTTALMAGLFFSWSCSVSPGLARLSDKEYITAMQSINRAIQNPWFLSCFIGTAMLLPLSTYLHYGEQISVGFWLLFVASIFYLLGVMGVTIFGNVPLNEALDSFNVHYATVHEISKRRVGFELPWNRLNTIRTATSLVSFIFVILACMKKNS
ncbi:MAG: anthrone oxygenase family protein [Cyclobacteriaceae bacterium]